MSSSSSIPRRCLILPQDVLRQNFAMDEFTKVRRRLENTKVFNNEMIIRNSISSSRRRAAPQNDDNKRSSNPFGDLPDAVLKHILEYARPKSYLTMRSEAKQERVGELSKTYAEHQCKEEKLRRREADALGEWVDRRQNSDSTATTKSSHRKRSIDEINPNNDENVPIRRAFRGSNEITFRKNAIDIINDLQTPGWRFSTILLNPDTHLTDPCFQSFRRCVASWPGWTTKRVIATRDELQSLGLDTHKSSNNLYFVKVCYEKPKVEPPRAYVQSIEPGWKIALCNLLYLLGKDRYRPKQSSSPRV